MIRHLKDSSKYRIAGVKIMELLKPSNLSSEILADNSFSSLLVLCSDTSRVRRLLENAGYQDVKINQALSKRLLDYPKAERPKLVEKTLNTILKDYERMLVSSFEMLFDPRYEIDVIKFFCEKARKCKVALKWPGQLIDSKLIYANPEDPDYHEYNCNAYQLRIVK